MEATPEISRTSPGTRSASHWRDELGATLRLGVPMALTQIVQFSINTIDVLMIGRLGPEALAGASVGLVVVFTIYMAGFGPAMAVSPMVSQALGADADNTREARRSVRMGLWAVLLFYPVALLFLALTTPIALALGQPEAAARLAGPYVLAMAPGMPFAIGLLILRNFLAAVDRTRVPLVIIVLMTIVNAVLNALLIFGAFGFPRLELVGAGIASSLSHIFGFVLMALYINRDAASRRFEIFRNLHRPDWPYLAELLRLAWPIALTTLFEGLLFNASALLMGRIGVDELAAYQVALNVAALAFMIPFGLSMAGGTRIGLAAGRGSRDGAILAASVTTGLCAGVMIVWGLAVGLFPRQIAGLYLNLAEPENRPVIHFVAGFLPIAAAFMLFDGIQVAANQLLRGLKDVRLPMIITGVSYWLVGFPTAAWLGLGTGVGAPGIWYGLLAGLLCAAILLGGRLLWLTRAAAWSKRTRFS